MWYIYAPRPSGWRTGLSRPGVGAEAAVAAAQEEAERYAEERDAFADRVTEVQLQLLASEDHCKKVEEKEQRLQKDTNGN